MAGIGFVGALYAHCAGYRARGWMGLELKELGELSVGGTRFLLNSHQNNEDMLFSLENVVEN